MHRFNVLAYRSRSALIAAVAAHAQDRVRAKEVVVGLGAEPRTMPRV